MRTQYTSHHTHTRICISCLRRRSLKRILYTFTEQVVGSFVLLAARSSKHLPLQKNSRHALLSCLFVRIISAHRFCIHSRSRSSGSEPCRRRTVGVLCPVVYIENHICRPTVVRQRQTKFTRTSLLTQTCS